MWQRGNKKISLLVVAKGTAIPWSAYAQALPIVCSKIRELETQLKAVRIDVDAKQTQAQLLYLAGEEK